MKMSDCFLIPASAWVLAIYWAEEIALVGLAFLRIALDEPFLDPVILTPSRE
jgi:hypothetical protein